MRLHDFLEFHGRQHPQTEFAVAPGLRITYEQANRAVDGIAAALLDAGMRRGDRIGLLLKNSISCVLVYHGISKCGLVATPINTRLVPRDWARILEDAAARVLICDAEFAAEVDTLRQHLPHIERLVAIGAAPRSGWVDFHRWTSECSGQRSADDVREDDAALLLYTSGTTGQPRGALLTHRAVTANLAQVGLAHQLQPADRFLLVLSLQHAAGVMTMLHVVSWGGSLLVQRDFEPHNVVEALACREVVSTMMVPTMIRALLSEVTDLDQRTFPRLRLVVYGGSPMDEPTLRRAMEIFRCDFAQRYGSTETLSVCWLSPDDHRLALSERPGLLQSAGRPLVGTQIRIANTDGDPAPLGTLGELLVRGPQLMRGYWHAPAETDRVMQDGWIHTGDVGHMDAEGYVHLHDRLLDKIVTGGEDVYPHEIEETLHKHPEVVEAAVIGVPDGKWGERIKAIVVLHEGSEHTSALLIDFCRQHLAAFKAPASIDFVDRLPRSATGKVLRRELREPFWRDRKQQIG